MSILLKNTLKLLKFRQFFKRRAELLMFRDETNAWKKVHCALYEMALLSIGCETLFFCFIKQWLLARSKDMNLSRAAAQEETIAKSVLQTIVNSSAVLLHFFPHQAGGLIVKRHCFIQFV